MKKSFYPTSLLVLTLILFFLGMRVSDAFVPLPDCFAHLEKTQQGDFDAELTGHQTESKQKIIAVDAVTSCCKVSLPSPVTGSLTLCQAHRLFSSLQKTQLPSRASPV